MAVTNCDRCIPCSWHYVVQNKMRKVGTCATMRNSVTNSHPQYPDGSPIRVIVRGHTILDDAWKYIVEIQGPHVAYYVQGIDNLTVSHLVVDPSSLQF